MAANTYITTTNVVTGLGNQVYQLLEVAVGTDVSANAVLLQKIEETNAQIDSYLRARYNLPLAFVSADLVAAGINLVRWLLVLRRPEVATEADRSLFEDARAYLRELAKGTALLDVAAPEGTSNAAHASVVTLGENDTSLPRNQDWARAF